MECIIRHNIRHDIVDHFVDATNMIDIGKGEVLLNKGEILQAFFLFFQIVPENNTKEQQ